jgi:hypothetical protein
VNRMWSSTGDPAGENPSPLISLIVVLTALAGGLGLLYAVLQDGPSGTFLVLDVLVGSLCCLALAWRHRAPATTPGY